MGAISIKWDITGKCNLKCKHCLVGDSFGPDKSCKEISFEEKMKIAEKLPEDSIRHINLLGGEPTLLGDDFFALLKKCSEKGIKTTFNTNGILMNHEFIEKTIDSGAAGVIFSIDGPEARQHDAVRGEGTFDVIEKNLSHLLNYINKKQISFDTTINMVLSSINADSVGKMFDFCIDHGVKSLNILPLDYTGYAANNVKYLFLPDSDEIKAAENFAIYLRDKYPNIDMIDLDSRFILPPLMDYLENNFNISLPIARNCCGATTTFGYIDPFGNLYPCDRVAFEFADIDFGKDTEKKTSLVDNTFFEIWNSKYFTEMFKFITDRSHYSKYEPCNRCEYLDAGYCVPCPLYALRNEKIVFQQCLFAERKNGSLRLSQRFQESRKTGSHYLNQYQPKKIEIVPTKYMEILNTMIVKKNNGIRSNMEDGRQIIFNPEKNKFYSINSDGAKIWSSIDGNSTVEEIATSFSKKMNKKLNEIYNNVDLSCFGDNAEVVKEFIRALSSEGLVTLE